MKKTIQNLTVEVVQDIYPMNPREWDNLGTIVCFHRRYDLGDKHKFSEPSEVENYIEETKAIALNVYLYDHSGLSLSVSPFGCPWDSGQVGVIYVERARVLKEWQVETISDELREKVIACLRGEVETYSKYLSGEVYGFRIMDERGDIIESCFDFYDTSEAMSQGEAEAIGYLEREASARSFCANCGMVCA